MTPRIALLAALLGATLCSIVWAQSAPEGVARTETTARTNPSHAIFPTQSLPLHFDHARHVGLGGMTCERCHVAARTSEHAEDSLIPPEAVCTPCHDIRRDEPLRAATPVARCDGCHVGWSPNTPHAVERVVVPTPNLHFSHRAHVSRGQTCVSCHGNLRTTSLATRFELPTMQSCLACHQPGQAPSACTTCHLTEPNGLLRTHFAEGWLNPPEWMHGLHHDADFWVNHRTAAAENGARCEPCHHEDECAACHDGRVRDRRTHPNDYLSQHPMDARLNSNACSSCHRVSSFCIACHERSGVAETSAPAAQSMVRFHPPASVWVSGPVTSQHHGAEARRALTSCVSCHAEQDCTTCHATRGVGGGGFSPHPPGFASHCGALLRASSRPCRVCHDDLATLATRCR